MINRMLRDGLIFHKVGLILGAIAGVLVGLIVSAEADKYEVADISEETSEQTD